MRKTLELFLTGMARLFVCLFTLAFAASSALACDSPDVRTDIRPMPDGGGPTEIHMAFGVSDVLGVDDVNQQIEIDLFLEMRWEDPRLANMAGCRLPVVDVWFPRIYVLNSSNLVAKRRNAQDEVSIGAGGIVTYSNRVYGNISTYHNLQQFPFDKHEFQIEVGIPDAEIEEFTIVPDPDETWIADRLNVEGWDFGTVSIVAGDKSMRAAKSELGLATLILSAARNSEYYIFRVLLLLAIVVAMSWVIFWVPPERYEFQIGIGSTAMLTSIAFNFSVANSLPPVGYLTIMDRLVIWAVLLVFLATIQALITARFVIKDRVETALRMDRIARYAFPLAFIGGWASIIRFY